MVRFRYANIIVLVLAILSFAPVGAVNYLLDGYVRTRESARLQTAMDGIAASIAASANEAMASLDRILADSPSLCTPTFIANVHNEMLTSLHLKQVLIENSSGVQYCDAFGAPVSYVPMSTPLSIPGHSQTVQVVRLAGLDMPLLKISQAYGAQREVSAFVPVLANAASELLPAVRPASMVRIAFTNGDPIVTVGDSAGFDHRASDASFISAQAFAGEIPLRVEAAVSFAQMRSSYRGLDIGFTLIACAMSAAFLLLMLQYVRRTSLPAFDLERAISRGELRPYYQPVIDLSTGRLSGCEMLCRWVKPDGKMIPPGAFIDYAEMTGLALPMTVSLMQQVRADLSDLCRELPDLKVSINLFEGHFRDTSIIDDVQAIFGGSPIRYSQLVFEITERRPLGNSALAHSVIDGLHKLGSKLAMDDAGTGHSNLAYLQTLGVDVIKIDRVFVDMIKPGTVQVPVLDGLIAVARDLHTEIIAEGVETEEQALYLRAHGVVMAQGFLFAPALKADSFRQLARALNRPAHEDDTVLPHAA